MWVLLWVVVHTRPCGVLGRHPRGWPSGPCACFFLPRKAGPREAWQRLCLWRPPRERSRRSAVEVRRSWCIPVLRRDPTQVSREVASLPRSLLHYHNPLTSLGGRMLYKWLLVGGRWPVHKCLWLVIVAVKGRGPTQRGGRAKSLCSVTCGRSRKQGAGENGVQWVFLNYVCTQ